MSNILCRSMALSILMTVIACTESPGEPRPVKLSTAKDPAIRIIANAFFASGSRLIIVNEDHSIDWHRHVSACILDEIAQAGPVILGAEAYHQHGVRDAKDVDPRGYAEEPFFQHIWHVARYYGMPVFGYDTGYEDEDGFAASHTLFTDDELAQRGLRPGAVNRRDAKAAENILEYSAPYPEYTVYLHVGFQHASEIWRDYEEGSEGWLAAQLAHLSGENPLTVYQVSPGRFARYETHGRVETDLALCSAASNMIPVLRTGQGQIGCLQRTAIGGAGMGSDYIIADPVNGSDHVDMARAALCDVH